MLETLTQLVFGFALVVSFLFGLSAGRQKLAVIGLMLIFASFLIALIWSSQCHIADYVLLKCNPKAAVFSGMGIGLLLASVIPKQSK